MNKDIIKITEERLKEKAIQEFDKLSNYKRQYLIDLIKEVGKYKEDNEVSYLEFKEIIIGKGYMR